MGKPYVDPQNWNGPTSVVPFTPLQQRWTTFWTTTLPRLATSHFVTLTWPNGKPLPLPTWSVTLDCGFAFVILDNVVGVNKPWTKVIDAPAIANMTEGQLEDCIELAEQIVAGDAEIEDLFEMSLVVRGWTSLLTPQAVSTRYRKRAFVDDEDVQSWLVDSEKPTAKKSRKQEAADSWSKVSLRSGTSINWLLSQANEMRPDVQYIIAQSPDLSGFQKEALTMLTQVPRGCYTTYQAISNAMRMRQGHSTPSSGFARAVGSAMSTNPFAPTAPCHRALPSNGRLIGASSDGEAEKDFYREKERLLDEEGVGFDDNGKVVGEPFTDFV